MLRYTLKRLLSLALSLIVASVVIFVAIEVVPGDPASYMLGINAQPDTVAALREELGLNAGPVARYFTWIFGLMRGDFGISYTYRTPVAAMIGDRLWISLPLALFALTLSTLIAFPAGILAATRRGSPWDLGVMGVTQLGVAVPNFWFAMLMVLVFAINLRWFSAGGFPGWDAGLWAGLKALLGLPGRKAIKLSAAEQCRWRKAARKVWEEYVARASARGVDAKRVLATALEILSQVRKEGARR